MANALKYVAHTGSLAYAGITTQEVSFSHPVLHEPEITLKGSRNALPRDFGRIIGLIEDGTISTGPWITHRTTCENMIAKFDNYTYPQPRILKQSFPYRRHLNIVSRWRSIK